MGMLRTSDLHSNSILGCVVLCCVVVVQYCVVESGSVMSCVVFVVSCHDVLHHGLCRYVFCLLSSSDTLCSVVMWFVFVVLRCSVMCSAVCIAPYTALCSVVSVVRHLVPECVPCVCGVMS